MSRAPRFLTLVALCLSAGLTSATEVPPIDINLQPSNVLPQVGQTFTATFQLISDTGGIVTDVGFISENPNPEQPFQLDYWHNISHDAPPSLTLLPAQPANINMIATPTDVMEPLRIQFKLDGKWVRHDFYLMPRGPYTAVSSPNGPGAQSSNKADFRRDTTLAIPPMPNGEVEALSPGDGALQKGNVIVRGTVRYPLPDRTARGADGVTIRAYDQRNGAWPDVYLGGQVTDPDGDFEFIVDFPNVTADLYVEVEIANGVSRVMTFAPPDGSFAQNPYPTYKFKTIAMNDFNGYLAEVDFIMPADEELYAAMHIHSTIAKAWRWLNSMGYGGIDDVAVFWPTGDSASYAPGKDRIYVSTDRQWDEYAVAHEYGHHWIYNYGAKLATEYCNTGGYGDDGDDCSHTPWCRENSGVAWSEGFAEWFGATVRKEIEDDYGPTMSDDSFEVIGQCGGQTPSVFNVTEGLLAALLTDIADGSDEVDPQGLFGGEDKLNFGAATVLSLADDYNPVTPYTFVGALLGAYPNHRQKIWATVANNRYNFDSTSPPTVAALSSTSHQSSGDSPDRTIDLVWDDVTDVDSGIDYYEIQMSPTGLYTNPQTYSAPYGGAWTSPELQPGTYWFRIRPHDRSGLGGAWTLFNGGITIRQAVPPDLVPSHGTWPTPIVAKNWVGPAHEDSPLLFGNVQNTYYSMSVGNGGELDATGRQHHRFYVDGALTHWWFTENLPAFGQVSVLDIGPDLVRGGRHTLTLIADADEEMSESDETNNWYDRQLVWFPLNINENWMARIKAPDAFGGFDTIGIFSSPNCDGFNYVTQSGVFRGAVVYSDQLLDDHDVRIFSGTTGSTNGFSTLGAHAMSSRPAGCLDAVFTVNDATTNVAQNVGVYNFGYASTGFQIRRLDSVPLSDEVETGLSLAAGEYMKLYHTSLIGGLPGGDFGTLRLNSDPADGPLHAAVFSPAAGSHAGLDNPVVTGVSDANGELVIQWQYTTAKQLVAVWQDPIDVPAAKADKAVNASLWVGRQPPDLVPYAPAGWYAPVVPTLLLPGSASSVPAPTSLLGNAFATCFNLSVRNDSPVPAGSNGKFVFLDGVSLVGTQIGGLNPNQVHSSNYPTQYAIQGGRHTLSAIADGVFEVDELSEANNAFGQQWVWSPLDLPAPGGWVVRGPAPMADGGWQDVLATPVAVPNGNPVWFNCDGLRTPQPVISGDDGWWQAVAVLPGGSHDVDAKLYEVTTGSVFAGFQEMRQASLWGDDGSDYVLVNFRNTSPRPFDVGVFGFTQESNGYYAQTVASLHLGANPSGQFGPFAVGSNNILRLHEMYFDPGWKSIQLTNHTGSIDWGMTFHRAKIPYQSKTSVTGTNNISWDQGGGGGGEQITVYVPEAGYYCLAVWRVDDSNLTAGRYNLIVDTTTSVDTPREVPTRTQLASIAPNPFNPRTEIEFALKESGEVELVIYNVRGERVRSLKRQHMEAGVHRANWNGVDDAGRGVASGVYFVELRSQGVVDRRKLTLLK